MNIDTKLITSLLSEYMHITDSNFYFDGNDLSFYEKNNNFILDLGIDEYGYNFYFKNYITNEEILSDNITFLELQNSSMLNIIKSIGNI